MSSLKKESQQGLVLIRMEHRRLENTQSPSCLIMAWFNLNMLTLHQIKINIALGDDYRIWDSAVNVYIGSDTEEEFQEEEPQTVGIVRDLENDEVDNTNASIDRIGQQDICSEEDVHQEAPESGMVLQVAWRRKQEDSTGIGVTPRRCTGTGGKARKRSRLN
ncbi:hypothetical protein HOY80DRAFT_1001894 [Tuber brumale]|nr:hypothetical protein HOY80DRAFT_1001894 [Tuber brumale]